jgi:hypothetical protein
MESERATIRNAFLRPYSNLSPELQSAAAQLYDLHYVHIWSISVRIRKDPKLKLDSNP